MALAPMTDVTDAAFREIIAKYSLMGKGGGPNVLWTEFVSADGLCHEKGRAKLLKDLEYSNGERPIVAQLFGARPEKMEEAAAFVEKLGFDGLDINMGCPDRTIEKQKAGAVLMKDPKLAREIIRAAKRGAPKLPISVKTRLGYNTDELEVWLPELLAEDLAAITIHARTRKEMSSVPARFDRVKRAVEIRNATGTGTLILGNGDVSDLANAFLIAKETKADGIMLGRAIFGTPWLFAPLGQFRSAAEGLAFTDIKIVHPTVEERLQIMLEHTRLFEEKFNGLKSFAVMKKHFKAYVQDFDGAKELRAELMDAKNAESVASVLGEFLRG